MAKTRVKGGKQIKDFLRKARSAQRIKNTEVGFFQDARYPDGTPVTNVAAWNEFGTSNGVPERPFFRLAIAGAEDDLLALLEREIDPKTLAITQQLADRVGLTLQAAIRLSITHLRNPPNAPRTILPRPVGKGSSNPLIDEGIMRESVTFRHNR